MARASGSTSLCKPSSVSHPDRSRCGGSHSSGTAIARCLMRPTRRLGRAILLPDRPWRSSRAAPAYAALLPMGFTLPLALPRARWALTPPFHPCHRACLGVQARRRFVFCGTLLGVSVTGRYPASCSSELGLSSRRPASSASDCPSGVDTLSLQRLSGLDESWQAFLAAIHAAMRASSPAVASM